MKSSLTDAELIATYQAGDEAAFEMLVARHLSAVYSFVARYVGAPDEADDVVQDVFVKVWKYLNRFDHSKNFKTWLFTIAKNTALDLLKKKKAVVFSDLSDPDESGPSFEETLHGDEPLPAELLDAAQNQRLLNELLAELHPDYKAVVLLRLDSQLTFREVAETLGKPLNTVKSHYRRAVALLAEKLADSHQMRDDSRIKTNL